MLTQQDAKRYQRLFDEMHVLDPNLKSEIIIDEIKAVTTKIEQKLKRTTMGKKVAIFIGEMR